MRSPDHSFIVGVTQFAEMAGRSRKWARDKYEEWLEEQEKGGPQRVFVSSRKRNLIYSSIGIIQREIVGIRDPVVTRHLRQHDQDIDFLTRRMEKLSDEIRELRKLLGVKRTS